MNKKNIFFVGAMALVVLAVFVLMESDEARADTDWPTGPITKNTVWTQEDSPYNVEGIVTVEEKARLTVEPGVEVRFNSGSDADYGEFGMVVLGEMDATGAVFTRHPDNSQNVAWAGITFGDSKKTSDISSCTIEYADEGIHTTDGTALNLHGSTITWGNRGISMEGSSGLTVTDNEIGMAQVGIYIVDSHDIRIENSEITGCQDIGILVDYGEFQSYNIDILNCAVKANLVTGVEFRSVYDSEISDCDISENIVRNVLLDSQDKMTNIHDIVVSNNMIRAWTTDEYFTSNGIEIYIGTAIEVTQCTILGNNQFGMYVSDSEVTVKGNEIAFSTNYYGLFCWNTQLTLINNYFHHNSYSLWTTGGTAVFSSGNAYKSDMTSVTAYYTRLYMEYDTLTNVQHGISAYEGTTVRLYGCSIKGSAHGGIGVRLFSSVRLYMTDCTVSNFFDGVNVGWTPETYIIDNVFVHNRDVAISVGTTSMDIMVNITGNLINHGGGGIIIGGGLFSVHCTGEIIKDNVINNVDYGIMLHYCNVPVENNQVNRASLYGIHVKVASPELKNNVVRNSNIGIYVEWWSDPLIQENTINNCLWGVYVAFMSQATIEGNDIVTGDVGIACDIGCYISVRENFIRGFRHYGIIVFQGSADISGNVIRNCREGIYLFMSTGSVTENHISGCNVGILLQYSKVSVKSNTFRRNAVDIMYLP